MRKSAYFYGILAVIVGIVILIGCTPTPEVIVVTATPEEDPTPTQEILLNPHADCAEREETCYVNPNPKLLGGSMLHTHWQGRALNVPEGYRPKIASSPAPFVYCKLEYGGCQFEFQWISGAFGYQTEPLTLYPHTPYMIKMVYSMDAACSHGDYCNTSMLSVGTLIFVDDVRYSIQAQPVASLTGQDMEALWAFRLMVDEPVSVNIQTFLNVQWATFAEPAKFIIHEIGVIALPEDYRGFVYSLGGSS